MPDLNVTLVRLCPVALWAGSVFAFTPLFPFPDRTNRLLSESVNEMVEGKYWMTPNHSGTGIAHNVFDHMAHIMTVTVYRTMCTGGLAPLKGALG